MSQPIADSKTASLSRRFGIDRQALERLLAVCIVILWLLFWEFSIQGRLLDRRFFPPPSAFALTFLDLLLSGELGRQLPPSLQRLLTGYLLGAIPGLLLGAALGRSHWLNAGCGPLLVILGAFPATALLPVIWLIFATELAKPVIVAISVFFPVLYCTRLSVRTAPTDGQEVVPTHNASALTSCHSWHGGPSLGQIFLGLKLASGISMLTLMPAEMLITTANTPKTGLGYLIWASWQTFSVETMFVGIAIAGTFGSLVWLAVDVVQRVVSARLGTV